MDQIVLNLAYGLNLQASIGWFLPIFIGVTNVIPTLLSLFFYADKSAQFNANKILIEEHYLYDFIVVGGGTAGSILANRLSKDHRVLLLERGGEPNPLTAVPGLETALINRPETDYGYLTVPQNASCLALNNRQSLWSRGNTLGGSTILNAMAFLRGHPYDYDIWAHWTKDNRWSYEKLIPFFLKHEDYCFECDRHNSPTNRNFHATKGELHLTKPTMMNLIDEFLDGMEFIGNPRADLNAPFAKGCDSVSYTQKFGRRMSARDAFINPIRKRNTLKIVKFARVYRVLIDKNVAYGVEYEHFGKVVHAGVTKEVILSAGAIDSPKILMLSGIGPQEHLKQLGIKTIVDSPHVGKNLQDHVGTSLGPFIINQPLSYLEGRNINIIAANEFLKNGTGPFTLSFAQAVGIMSSSKTEFPDYPDIQIGLSAQGVSPGTAGALSRFYNARTDILDQFFNPLINKDAFSLIINYSRPKSRGDVKLKSGDYKDDPIIDPNYYSMHMDLEVLLEGIKKALYMVEHAPSFKYLGATLSPVRFPGCENLVFKSDAYFECLARHFTLTLHHFAGTVRMSGDKDGVLDSELRVQGVKNLRVVDASIMPFITTMNTMAPTMVIAERGAAFILEYWKCNRDRDNNEI